MPVLWAVNVIVCVPSRRASSMAVTLTAALVAPAGMVTVVGTVASEGSLEERLITVAVLEAWPLFRTVNVAAFGPAFSAIEVRSSERVS